MKKFRLISAYLALIAAFSFTSCQNEGLDSDLLNNVNPQQPAGPAIFKVDFGGQTFMATNATAQIQGTLLTIAGVRGTNGETITLTIPNGTATGSYTTADQMYVPSLTSTAFYANEDDAGAQNGAVVITNINTTARTISGTFSFTGHYSDFTQNLPTVAFTNGTFQNIPYTGSFPNTNPGPVNPNPQPQTEYLKAKFNGTMVEMNTFTSNSQMGMLIISGSNGTQTLQLTMSENITAGTYSIGMAMPQAIVSVGTTGYMATSGSLTIISNSNGWIKGTFSFNGTDLTSPGNTMSITEGSFNIEL